LLRVIAAERLTDVIAPIGALTASCRTNIAVNANLVLGGVAAELTARNRVGSLADAGAIHATLSGCALRIDATFVA
jgi:hypothetical protein